MSFSAGEPGIALNESPVTMAVIRSIPSDGLPIWVLLLGHIGSHVDITSERKGHQAKLGRGKVSLQIRQAPNTGLGRRRLPNTREGTSFVRGVSQE